MSILTALTTAVFGTRKVAGTTVFPREIQWDNYSCYARCVLSILRHYGRKVSYGPIKRALKTKPGGTYEYNALPVIRQYGCTARVRTRLTVATLRRALEEGSAVILYVDQGAHVLVVYGLDKEYAYVSEPALSKTLHKRMCRDTLLHRWTGRAVIVRDREKPQ